MISLNSSLEKMIGFELAQYVSTRQSSLLLPGFSCSQGWDRGGRGDFWEGWSMSSNLGWEGSSSPQDQLKYNQCFYRNLAISQNLSLLVKYISPPICEQTMFPGSKCGGWGAWGEEESRKSVGRTERRGKATNIYYQGSGCVILLAITRNQLIKENYVFKAGER